MSPSVLLSWQPNISSLGNNKANKPYVSDDVGISPHISNFPSSISITGHCTNKSSLEGGVLVFIMCARILSGNCYCSCHICGLKIDPPESVCPSCPPAIHHGSVLNLLFSECLKCHGAVDSTLQTSNKQTNNFCVACGCKRGFESNEACSH